jgi:hypothetical protein
MDWAHRSAARDLRDLGRPRPDGLELIADLAAGGFRRLG